MLTLTRGRMEGFEGIALANFELSLADHVCEFTPKHAELLGREGVLRVVRYGIDRAARHGFDGHEPLRLFLEMIFLLGSEFDTDPQYPWAGEILGDAASPSQDERAAKLYSKLKEFLDLVAGPENEFAIAALRRAKEVKIADALAGGKGSEESLLSLMAAIYPEKFGYVGKPAVQALLREAAAAVRPFAPTLPGVVLFSGLMFTLGHGFMNDPQHPWIQGTLANEAVADPNKRVERLHSKAMTYLDRVLEYLG